MTTSTTALRNDDQAAIARDRMLARRAKRNAIVAVVIFVVALAMIATPFVLRGISAMRQQANIDQANSNVSSWPNARTENEIRKAKAYNRALYEKGQSSIGEVVDPFQDLNAKVGDAENLGSDSKKVADSVSAKDKTYQGLLDAGSGVMGTIHIPKISVNLPIFHGTSSKVLGMGAGHLYGTSLPVGGKNTHSVITGHRGMVTALMFTRLDEMRVGDIFTIDVMGEKLGYRVDKITVILPTEGTKYLTIRPGEDRVTLMTCTPYGVNTHRLLVSGVRVPLKDLGAQKDNQLYFAVTLAAVTVTCAVASIVIARKQRWLPMRHAAHR